ncbi:MAG TPA: hypothetical protein IAB62_03740 [Candidatus Coprocola pullicola]|nr:hypothetical protein [Candidatus Coprocola pullicola]
MQQNKMTLKMNRRVVFVPSKSISVASGAFGTDFVRSFYFNKLSNKRIVTFATNIFLTSVFIFSIIPKRIRKVMTTGNSKIFKSSDYIYE